LKHNLKRGRKKRRILGVTGTHVNAYLHTTYLEVPDIGGCRCDCWFSEDYAGGKAGAGLTYGLLGQNDFFLNYTISFNRKAKTFSIVG